MFCHLLTLQKVAGRLVYTVARVLFNKNLIAMIGRLLQW